MMSNNYPEGYGFFYIQLVRKADMKEVYSSPLYGIDNSDAMDRDKISARLNYYFDRINSGIKQQLESPKLTPEQKASLKLIDKADYYIRMATCVPPGYCFQPVLWTVEASSFL